MGDKPLMSQSSLGVWVIGQLAMLPFEGSRMSGWALGLEKRTLTRVARHGKGMT